MLGLETTVISGEELQKGGFGGKFSNNSWLKYFFQNNKSCIGISLWSPRKPHCWKAEWSFGMEVCVFRIVVVHCGDPTPLPYTACPGGGNLPTALPQPWRGCSVTLLQACTRWVKLQRVLQRLSCWVINLKVLRKLLPGSARALCTTRAASASKPRWEILFSVHLLWDQISKASVRSSSHKYH